MSKFFAPATSQPADAGNDNGPSTIEESKTEVSSMLAVGVETTLSKWMAPDLTASRMVTPELMIAANVERQAREERNEALALLRDSRALQAIADDDRRMAYGAPSL
jgi:hypothetical protein